MGFKNALFVVSHSDTYIVSMQQTVHSALLRGFEPCFAARKPVYKSPGASVHKLKACVHGLLVCRLLLRKEALLAMKKIFTVNRKM